MDGAVGVDGAVVVGLLGRGVGKSGSVNDESGSRVAVPSIDDWHPARTAAHASVPAATNRILIVIQPTHDVAGVTQVARGGMVHFTVVGLQRA